MKILSSAGSKTKYLIASGTIIVLAAAGGSYYYLNQTNPEPDNQPTEQTEQADQTPSSDTRDSSKKDSNNNSDISDGQANSDMKSPRAPKQNQALQMPQGTFANLYDVTMGQQMTSTCTTNAGVQCQIVFTKGNLKKSLPKQSTDAGGNTEWYWTPKSIGLSSGTWHIKAVASYKDQTKTKDNDPLTLEVKP